MTTPELWKYLGKNSQGKPTYCCRTCGFGLVSSLDETPLPVNCPNCEQMEDDGLDKNDMPIAQLKYQGGYAYVDILRLNNLPDGSLLYARHISTEQQLSRARAIINELRVLIENNLPVDKSAPIWEMVKNFIREDKP